MFKYVHLLMAYAAAMTLQGGRTVNGKAYPPGAPAPVNFTLDFTNEPGDLMVQDARDGKFFKAGSVTETG